MQNLAHTKVKDIIIGKGGYCCRIPPPPHTHELFLNKIITPYLTLMKMFLDNWLGTHVQKCYPSHKHDQITPLRRHIVVSKLHVMYLPVNSLKPPRSAVFKPLDVTVKFQSEFCFIFFLFAALEELYQLTNRISARLMVVLPIRRQNGQYFDEDSRYQLPTV